MSTDGARSAWLMKAEPESRIVKGKDVAFSIDHLEKAEVEHWDGVRNHEAKNLMKDRMRVGDPVLFYHSNCKVPGVAGIAEIHKNGYPDFTAYDPSHPYFDAKSSKDKPTWYMVDVKFVSKLPNFVPLKILQGLASSSIAPPEYLTPDDINSIKEMPLLDRGRLSVQPVSYRAFKAISALGQKGGWGNDGDKTTKSNPTVSEGSTRGRRAGEKRKKSPVVAEKQESSRPKRIRKKKQ